uniref:hypothetical protein n=1 Tax=Stieleria sedimenti TaxID=2976331 RepID=UPI00389A6537
MGTSCPLLLRIRVSSPSTHVPWPDMNIISAGIANREQRMTIMNWLLISCRMSLAVLDGVIVGQPFSAASSFQASRRPSSGSPS